MDYAKRIELLEQNIKRMKEERARLKEQNGKEYLASQIEKGGDIYDRYETNICTTQQKERPEAVNQNHRKLRRAYQDRYQRRCRGTSPTATGLRRLYRQLRSPVSLAPDLPIGRIREGYQRQPAPQGI